MLNLLGTDTDPNVGAKLGIASDTVRKKRARLGIPKYSPFTPEAIELMGKVSDESIAKKIGVHKAIVGQKRRELGIPSITKAREWTDEEISLLGKMSDLKLGEMLGISHDSLFELRKGFFLFRVYFSPLPGRIFLSVHVRFFN
jgi:hypothetical protein